MKTTAIAAIASGVIALGGVCALAASSTETAERRTVVAPVRVAVSSQRPSTSTSTKLVPAPVVRTLPPSRPAPSRETETKLAPEVAEASLLAKVRVDAFATLGQGQPRTRRPTSMVAGIPAPAYERRRASEREVAWLRGLLASPETKRRLEALRRMRAIDAAAVEEDVRRLLERESDVLVKRLGAQVLANGDVTVHAGALERLRRDDDAIVRLNASFGLARLGDPRERAWLERVCDAARTAAPEHASVIAATLSLSRAAGDGRRGGS